MYSGFSETGFASRTQEFYDLNSQKRRLLPTFLESVCSGLASVQAGLIRPVGLVRGFPLGTPRTRLLQHGTSQAATYFPEIRLQGPASVRAGFGETRLH